MEAIIKFLKSFGLSDQEIKKVLQEVPVDQKGFAGTNITKGIFEKGGKQVSADFPLVTETMVSPFKLDKYKGLSKKEALEKADEALKYLDKELTRTSNLIINQNLQLAPEQKINFSNNLRMKREFEKELEAFKTQPEAKIIQLETKQPVLKEGIEQLIKDAGQTSPPGTLVGDIESRINVLKAKAKEKGMTVDEILKETGESQVKYVAGQNEGYVRSMARQIMLNDIKSGKLKVPKEIQDTVSGASNIDVIEPFRNIYGENALEQLDSLIPDIKNFANEIEAEKFVRSKYEFTPNLNRPKESYTADEMEKILNEKPPEKKAKGGAMGLDYLTGQEPPKNGYAGGGRIGYAEGTEGAPSITLDTHEKAPDNEMFGSKLPETKSGIGGLYYGFKEDQRPIVIDPNTGKPIDSGNLKDLKKVFSSLLSDSRPEIGYATDKFNVGASKGINPFGDKSLKYGASYYPDKDQTFFLDAGPDYKTAGYLYKPNEAGSISLTGSKGSFGDKNFSLRGEYKFAKGGLGYLVGE